MRVEETLGVSHILRITEHELRLCLDKKLAALNLTYPQYSALSGIEANGGITNAALARECYIKAQTMMKIIENLLDLSLVKKKLDPSNGSKVRLHLTPKGEKLVCKAHTVVNEIEKAFIKGVNYPSMKGYLETCLINLKD